MLKLDSVDVAYGHIQALAGVTIEVRDGELVALLGANGAGKSTTLMAVSGICRPRAGTIVYNGIDLAKTSPFDIVGLGVVHCPEGRRIFGGLTVLENLRMGSMRRTDKATVRLDMDWVFSLRADGRAEASHAGRALARPCPAGRKGRIVTPRR